MQWTWGLAITPCQAPPTTKKPWLNSVLVKPTIHLSSPTSAVVLDFSAPWKLALANRMWVDEMMCMFWAQDLRSSCVSIHPWELLLGHERNSPGHPTEPRRIWGRPEVNPQLGAKLSWAQSNRDVSQQTCRWVSEKGMFIADYHWEFVVICYIAIAEWHSLKSGKDRGKSKDA